MHRTSRLLHASTIALALVALVASAAGAAAYYVSAGHPAASDANPGTFDAPWRTLRHALGVAGPGDTVSLRSGVYHEHVRFERGGNPAGHLVLSATPGETAVINGAGVTTSEDGIVVDQPYIRLVGLEIRGWSGNGIWAEGASYLEIIDCVIHDVTCGVGLAAGTHDVLVERVQVHDFNRYGFDASPAGGAPCARGVFRDCVAHTARDPEQNVDGFALGHGDQHGFLFERCSAYGVYDGFDLSARDTTLSACSAYACRNAAYKLWSDRGHLVNCIGHSSRTIVELDWDGEPGTVDLVNCTFYTADSYTVWVENSADTLHMRNCILAGGATIGLAFEQRDLGAYRGDHNLFHNCHPDRVIAVGYEDAFSLEQIAAGAWTAYSGQDEHSLVARTGAGLFVAPARFDLRLPPGSPAVDAGTSIDAPPEDHDGTLRPRGRAHDIGAYEL